MTAHRWPLRRKRPTFPRFVVIAALSAGLMTSATATGLPLSRAAATPTSVAPAPPALGDVVVESTIVRDRPPTARVTWSATGAATYDVTYHRYGAPGTILINGRNWADFDTNSSSWGPVSDPYRYPVRSVSGWEPSESTTLTVRVGGTRAQYVALDAYEAW